MQAVLRNSKRWQKVLSYFVSGRLKVVINDEEEEEEEEFSSVDTTVILPSGNAW